MKFSELLKSHRSTFDPTYDWVDRYDWGAATNDDILSMLDKEAVLEKHWSRMKGTGYTSARYRVGDALVEIDNNCRSRGGFYDAIFVYPQYYLHPDVIVEVAGDSGHEAVNAKIDGHWLLKHSKRLPDEHKIIRGKVRDMAILTERLRFEKGVVPTRDDLTAGWRVSQTEDRLRVYRNSQHVATIDTTKHGVVATVSNRVDAYAIAAICKYQFGLGATVTSHPKAWEGSEYLTVRVDYTIELEGTMRLIDVIRDLEPEFTGNVSKLSCAPGTSPEDIDSLLHSECTLERRYGSRTDDGGLWKEYRFGAGAGRLMVHEYTSIQWGLLRYLTFDAHWNEMLDVECVCNAEGVVMYVGITADSFPEEDGYYILRGKVLPEALKGIFASNTKASVKDGYLIFTES